MHRKLPVAAAVLLGALLLGLAGRWRWADSSPDSVFDPPVRPVQNRPPVPWRNPEADLQAIFPGSSNWSDAIRILSGSRVQIEAKLGRPMRADENVLLLHRIPEEGPGRGYILARRARGEQGAIELVVGLDVDGVLQGVRIQSLREPAGVVQALTNENWLNAFRGRTADRGFRVGTDLPPVPPEAQQSAEAIAACVHDLLVLFSATYVAGTSPHH